jgi:hypothetical protein
MTRDEYNKMYVTIRSRIRRLKVALIGKALNDTTLSVIKHLDSLAKELDILNSDERSLDEIEANIVAIENDLMVS